MQAHEEQLLLGGGMHVDLRNNHLSCTNRDILENIDLDAERITNLGCSTGGG